MDSTQVNEYRSPRIVQGQFRQLGGVHLHVDAGAEHTFLLSILKEMEQRFPGKITVISASVAGPQRKQLPSIYESHTPGSEEEEEFECFLSLDLGTRDCGIGCVREMIERLSQHHGTVIEVESVVGRIENGGKWEALPLSDIESISSQEVGFEPAPTKALELHHGINFPVRAQSISLADILRASKETGVGVGGWYNFHRANGLSFRSNSFHDTEGIQSIAEAEHRRLHDYLMNLGHPFELWSTVEFVLGIWKSPFCKMNSSHN